MLIRGIGEYHKREKKFSYENYINAFIKVRNVDTLVELIDGYLNVDKFSLNDLLNINNKNIKIAFSLYMNSEGFKRKWTNEELKLLKQKGFEDALLTLQRKITLIRINITLLPFLASTTGVYNDSLYKLLEENNLLHELYKETKDNTIIEYLLGRFPNFNTYKNIRKYLSNDERNKLLDNIVNYFISFNKKLDYKDFDAYDLKYICSKLIQKNCMNAEYAYMFLWMDYYNKEDKDKLIDIILKGSANVIYKTLINKAINLNKEEKEKLEKALRKTKNFKYNFYYSFKNNELELVESFGGYLMLQNFLLTSNKFSNKDELNKIIEYINSKIGTNEEEMYNNLKNIIFKDEDESYKDSFKKTNN